MSVKRDALKCKSYNSAAIESPTALPYTTNLLHDLLLSRPPAAAGIIAIKLWICCDVSNKVTVKNTLPIASPQSMGILFVWQKALFPVKMQHPKTREKKRLLKGRYAIHVKYRRQQPDSVAEWWRASGWEKETTAKSFQSWICKNCELKSQ